MPEAWRRLGARVSHPWLLSLGLSHWCCRRKCGHGGIGITANVDETLSSSQVSFQTLYNILHFTVSQLGQRGKMLAQGPVIRGNPRGRSLAIWLRGPSCDCLFLQEIGMSQVPLWRARGAENGAQGILMRQGLAGEPGWFPLPTGPPGLCAESSRVTWAGLSGTP